MTPERRQEIKGLLARPIGHTSQREVSTLRKAVKELLAEIATLKGEVERLKRENRRRSACDLVNDRFKRSIENHEEREGWLKDTNATLRIRLDALVKAVNEAIGIAENIRNLDPKIGADEIIDALAEAKQPPVEGKV